jgi:hypothetical protein
MLRNFLWFFPLKLGVYFIALLSIVASCGLMVTDVRFFEHSGMNQGNFGVRIVFLLASLLLANGVYQVSYCFLDSSEETRIIRKLFRRKIGKNLFLS